VTALPESYASFIARPGPALKLLVALMLSGFAFGAHAEPGERFFDTTLGELHGELELARREGKLGVMLVFGMAGCPSCRRMREEVLAREDVRAYFRGRFLIFSVDILGDVPVRDFQGRELREKDLAKAFRVRGTPTFVLVGLDGNTMAKYAGATRDAAEFLALGSYVADGAYRTLSFDQYHRR
jgi:thioredoxin-related protein